MSESAERHLPAEAAAAAVKAFVRINRKTLAEDGELLAMLLPQRFANAPVRDLQSFVIEKLTVENTALRAACRYGGAALGDGARAALLDLLDARTFEETIAVAMQAAKLFGATHAAICIESTMQAPSTKGVRLIAPGTAHALLGEDGTAALLTAGGAMLLGAAGGACRSLAAFRLRIGHETPTSLYVLGGEAQARFESAEALSDIGFFARALERSIRAWLDLPKS